MPDGFTVPLPGDRGTLVTGDGLHLLGPDAGPAVVLRGHEEFACHATFSPDGRLVASSTDARRRVRIWSVGEGREIGGFTIPFDGWYVRHAPALQFMAEDVR